MDETALTSIELEKSVSRHARLISLASFWEEPKDDSSPCCSPNHILHRGFLWQKE
jgi:hypothetical protein